VVGFGDSCISRRIFSSIKGSAQLGKREDIDEVQLAALKLTDTVKQFYNGCLDLHLADVTWHKFKSIFRHRF
jgi:hypothetical protein